MTAQQLATRIAIPRSLQLLLVLFTGTLASSLFSFLAQIMLARMLAPGDFGRLVALLATVNFFTSVATAGVSTFLLQAFGREGWGAVRWLRPAFSLVAIMTGLSAVFLGAYAARDYSGAAVVAAVIVLSGQIMVELAAARLQLTGSLIALAVWQAATQTGRLGAVIALAPVAPVSSAAVLAGYACVAGMVVGAGVFLLAGLWTGRVVLSGHGRFRSHSGPSASIVSTAREAVPFALVTMFYVLHFQGALIILEWLLGGEAAAQYNAALLVISALWLIPMVVYQKLLIAPLYRWSVHDRSMFAATFHLGAVAMGAMGTLLMIVTLVSAHWVITILFGHRYEAAAPVLMLLALTLPIRFVQCACSATFVSRKETEQKAAFIGASALVTAVTCCALIPVLGIAGAAVGNVLAEVTLLVLHIIAMEKYIDGVSITATASPPTLRAALAKVLSQANNAGA